MGNEIVAEEQHFSVTLTNALNEVNQALPKDFNKARFVQNAIALLNDNEQLQKFAKDCGTAPIKAGMLKAAYLGLDFMSKEAYLIPYGKQLNFMVDYRGATKLCKKYSIRPIKDIYAKVVREGDFFEESIDGVEQKIIFKPVPFNTGEIIGAFAVCVFDDGGMLYDTMSRKELDATRSKSKASNAMAWKDFASEMYKKTVLHRLCKHIEIDFDTPEQRLEFDKDVAIDTTENLAEEVKADVEVKGNVTEFKVEGEVVDATFVPVQNEFPQVSDDDLPDFLK